jgi:GDP-L-fucose synthase
MQTGRKCGSVDINSKIYVAGHTGMVGSAIVRKLRKEGFNNIVLKTHQKLNLINQQSVNNFFEEEKPDHVFLAAAKVGGIKANNTFRGQFLYENLMIQNNIIHAAHKIGVDKLFFLGSACIYPRTVTQVS